MKKVKLIKSLLISAPIIVTPLLANSCSKKIKVDAKYYVDALAKTLKPELDSISSTISYAASNNINNTLDITSEINTARTKANQNAKVKSDNIDHINLSFKGTNNLKVENDNGTYTLTVFPSFINSSSSQQTLTTTLSLTLSSSNKYTQSITNTYNIAKGFKAYRAGLGNGYVQSVYGSNDGNIIFVATREGISVGSKDGDRYDFYNYSKGINGLGSNIINSIYASSDGNTIYAATDGGISVGNNVSSPEVPNYEFTNYTDGVLNEGTNSIYASSDGNTIYASTGDGVSVGIKQSDNNRYKFTNYTPKIDGQIISVHASNNGTIFAGTTNGVILVGTKNGLSYTFKKYNIGSSSSSELFSIYASADGNTIYAGTYYRGVIIGTKNKDSSYKFKSVGLKGDIVRSVYVSPDGNTIYAANQNEVAVGIKSGSAYTFKNYYTGPYVSDIRTVYALNDGNAIYAGGIDGVAVSSSNWFTQNNSK